MLDKDRVKIYYYKNREEISRRRKLRYDSKKKRIEKLRDRYGLTEEDFANLLANQDNMCAICGQHNPGAKGWQIDHDHATGEVRGILCISCNTKLGWYENRKDSIENYLLNRVSKEPRNPFSR
jgi:hypothetical protein